MPIGIFLNNYLYITSILTFKKTKINFHPRLKIILLASFIIFLFLLTELFFRNKYKNFESNSYQYTIENFDPFLQFKLTDSYTSNINSYGFRGENISKTKPHGVYRIFMLGGSTVLSRSTNYEKTSSRILEKLLTKKYPSKKIEILNAGVDGYTSEHSLIQYLFKIKDFSPDLIIMWHGINDWYYSCTPPERAYGNFNSDYTHFLGANKLMASKYFKPQPFISTKIVIFDFIQKFLIDNWYSDIINDIKTKQPVKSYYSISEKANMYEMKEYPSLYSYQRNLKSLIQSVKSEKTTLILGNQPTLYRKNLSDTEKKTIYFPILHCTRDNKSPSLNSVANAMQRFNNTTREIAKHNDIHFIDLEKEIPKNLEYFTDDVHYTDKANKKIAQILYGFIASKIKID
jgi:lysophospholipase L1-like esterase